ncbi:MAG TPA: glycine--tRNA ligase subunit beta [Casimicrobiaceae bacterium]|jgi:glycyl-tRNA synthetase beta chain|nr:glycine--tRNA ligase subunit beta [Casimicrobiaceae bacterium]
MSETLVVELFTEELPPKALKRLGDAFAAGIESGLRERGFLDPQSVVTSYATPRRLAVSVTYVRPVAPDAEVVAKLMPARIARDASGVSEAFRKKMAGLGRPHLATASLDATDGPDRVYIASDGKADYVYLRSLARGQALARGLDESLANAIEQLPIAKLMSYQRPDGSTVKFARPAHRLLALHGADIVPVSALDLDAGRITNGHRFQSRGELTIATAEAWEPTLAAEGKVVASFGERRARIVAELEAAAAGARVIMPGDLLDEVTALVEWPKVYTGGFDPAFLDVPQECLILTMQQNQRYFALADPDGRLQSRFLLVSNTEPRDPGEIIRGNERVLRARLADAKFFYDQDRKQSLASRVDKLRSVRYHNELGTVAQRVERLRFLSSRIATMLGADPALADHAAMLAKADLVTDMVGEFPELQGVMGRYYAEHDGEPPAVAAAIEQHYWPRFAGDALPASPIAQSVALADKLLSIVEMFGIGNAPTGDKDPFGLRRAAVGVLRILMEKQLPLSLLKLVKLAFEAANAAPDIYRPEDVETFLLERLRAYLREQGYSANQVDALLCLRPSRIDLVPAQMEAIRTFATLPEAEALATANKRIGNILRKNESEVAPAVDRALLVDGAERELYAAVEELLPVVRDHVKRGDYTAALRSLASARTCVDRFFDDVLVMAADGALRANRLALLRGLSEAMNQVADISKLAV